MRRIGGKMGKVWKEGTNNTHYLNHMIIPPSMSLLHGLEHIHSNLHLHMVTSTEVTHTGGRGIFLGVFIWSTYRQSPIIRGHSLGFKLSRTPRSTVCVYVCMCMCVCVYVYVYVCILCVCVYVCVMVNVCV